MSGVSIGVTAAAVLLTVAAVAGAQTAWDTVRRRPIVDGESLAGVRLGASIEDATRALGSAPAKISQEQLNSITEYLYDLKGPNDDWALVITPTLTIGSTRVEAIHMTVLRRTREIVPYLGRTKRGYRPGESTTRLRALYGAPDEILQRPATTPVWWWYREAGLIVSPEIKGDDYFASQIAVIPPGLSAAEVRRLVLPP